MQLTRTSQKLKKTVLFNAEHSDVPFVAPSGSGYFTLLLFRHGTGRMTVCSRAEAENVSYPLVSPTAVCLRDDQNVTFDMTDTDVYSVVFSPTFINVNMRPSVMEEETYRALAETHRLFRLAPFMEVLAEYKCLEMNEEQMNAYVALCQAAIHVLDEKDPDNCWSCRIRACLMDMLVGLEAQYACKLQAARDDSVTFMSYRDIVIHIHGDLAHPCRIEDACRIFGINKNKLQRIFRLYSGGTYYDFIKATRLERGKCYLAFTGLKLSEIAARLGFSSGQHFYRFFRRETGMSPAGFRKTTVAERKAAFASARLSSAGDPGCFAT